MSNIEHPDHYNNGNIECIDAMLSAYGKDEVMTFCKINAFKYLWRSEHKNGIEDIKKAKWYIDKYVSLADKQYDECDCQDCEKWADEFDEWCKTHCCKGTPDNYKKKILPLMFKKKS